MVGKYTDYKDAYKSLNEALMHAGIKQHAKIEIFYCDAEQFEQNDLSKLKQVDAVLIPGGFGVRGTEGMIHAARWAREQKIPFFGICLGLHIALIEFARHVAGLPKANSSELDPKTPYPVIGLINEWLDVSGKKEIRNEQTELGGTMRLGAQACQLASGSLVKNLYQASQIFERHRHRYEVNNHFLPQLEQAGLKIGGRSIDGQLVETIELPDHPWFFACQFHPEFKSTPRDSHPLFLGFIRAALDYCSHRTS